MKELVDFETLVGVVIGYSSSHLMSVIGGNMH